MKTRMFAGLWFNKMSEGDLGQRLRGSVTLRGDADVRGSAERRSCATAALLYPRAIGGLCWWRFSRDRDLWYIICMSTPPWLERKQWDSHRQQTTEICLFMPEKQQRKTLIYVARKAPDAHSDQHNTHTHRAKLLTGCVFLLLNTTLNTKWTFFYPLGAIRLLTDTVSQTQCVEINALQNVERDPKCLKQN